MKDCGLHAIFSGPNTSKPRKGGAKHPYLIKDKQVWLPNQVWTTDITYLKLPSGMMYLVVILDVYSRKILAWWLSNTVDTSFCIDCLEEAIEKYGEPAVFHSDHGSQYTSNAFIAVLREHGMGYASA